MTVQGFLNLDKPAGMTSHDCVARVRRLLKLKRVGHAGTLDPAATGVLPIALDRATRLLQFLPQDKAYRATVRLGMQTNTDDLEGEVLHCQPCAHLELEDILPVLEHFRGKLEQIPPNFSAVQVQGKRLYNLARKGETIQVEPRSVEVFQLEVLDWRSGEFPELDLAIACGPGTYIRAIARDLGNTLGVGGTLARLIRTSSSGFDLCDSLSPSLLESQLQSGSFNPVAPEVALAHLPLLLLPDPLAQRWCQGQRLQYREIDSLVSDSNEPLRVHREGGQFLGIGQLDAGGVLLPLVVLVPG